MASPLDDVAGNDGGWLVSLVAADSTGREPLLDTPGGTTLSPPGPPNGVAAGLGVLSDVGTDCPAAGGSDAAGVWSAGGATGAWSDDGTGVFGVGESTTEVGGAEGCSATG